MKRKVLEKKRNPPWVKRRDKIMKRLVLVDYENINLDSVAEVDTTSTSLWIFVGPNQKNLPFETVAGLQRLGEACRWIKIARQGKNSLDFHICFELGAICAAPERPESVFVLSNDKGYDAVIDYANGKGMKTLRVTHLSQLPASTVSKPKSKYTGAIIENLRKIQPQKRPRKVSSLRSHLINCFKNSIPEGEIDVALEELFATQKLSEEKGHVKYEL